MKRLMRWGAILGVLGIAGWAVSKPMGAYLRERSRVHYREVEVTRGIVVAVVNSTGTVKPVQSVSVGTFVSGPIASIAVDFNSTRSRKDRPAGEDRSAALRGVRGPGPGLPRQSEGRRRAGQGPAPAGPQRRGPLARPAGRESHLHLRHRDGPVQVQADDAGGGARPGRRRRSIRPRPASTRPRPT